MAKEDQETLQLFLFLFNSQMIKPKSKSVWTKWALLLNSWLKAKWIKVFLNWVYSLILLDRSMPNQDWIYTNLIFHNQSLEILCLLVLMFMLWAIDLSLECVLVTTKLWLNTILKLPIKIWKKKCSTKTSLKMNKRL